MKKTVIKVLFGLWFASLAMGAENWKIKLEEAKVYLDQKQYIQSEQILQTLLKDHPEDWEINYYLGLVKLGKGENESAEQFLRKASQINPEDLHIRLALAYALLNLKKADMAKRELDLVLIRQPENTRALYLRGVCFILKNDCASAKTDLTRAKELDSSYEASASYYLGVCASQAGRTTEARKHFDQAISAGAGTTWAEQAKQARERLKEKKPWFARADLFYQYDTNIVPVAEEDALPEQVSEMDDSRGVLWLVGGYRPLIRDEGEIALDGRFYDSWHFEEEELNLMIYQLSVNGFYNFEILKQPARVYAQYLYQSAGLGEDYDYYSTSHRANSSFFLAETKSLITELSYQYQYEYFAEPGEGDFDRDNNSHQIMLGQHFYVWNNQVDLSIFGRYRRVSADGRNYDANRYGGRAMARLMEWKKLSAWAYFDYDYRDYYRSTYDRLDRVYNYALEVEYQFIKYLAVFAGASYTYYDSNIENYEYDRQIYSAGIRAEF